MKNNGTKPLADGIAITRFSEDAGRGKAGKRHTDTTQQDTMAAIATANRIRITQWLDESDVSGGTPLERRPYGDAIKRVEDPDDPVKAILFAYRSRHDRHVIEGSKAIQRMDRAGGVLLVGGTVLTHATPAKWFEATAGSLMGEWQLREIAYSTHKGVAEAVALGHTPLQSAPLGLELYAPNNQVRPVSDESVLRVVRRAFQMRADRATIDEVRAYLAANGHRRSYQAVRRMLANSLYVGVLRYGGTKRDDGSITPEYIKEGLFEPIVDPKIWQRVQDMRTDAPGSMAGRYSKRENLLARLGVLMCDTCGARMTVITREVTGKVYAYYRCGRGRAHDCPAPPTISAPAVEQYVLDAAIGEVTDIVEHESSTREAREAADDALAAEARVDDLEAKYMDLGPGTHPSALAKLEEARASAQAQRAHATELSADQEEDWLGAAEILASTDPMWLPHKRRILRALMAGRVSVAANGRHGGSNGASRPVDQRVTIAPRGKSRRTSRP